MLLTTSTRAVLATVWNWIKALMTYILKSGPVPKHIAFIMNGNRRFATKQGLQPISGHQQGYQKVPAAPASIPRAPAMPHTMSCVQLLDALQWCLDLDVQAITVYAFSIDNFRRDKQEVDALMALAEEKLLDLLDVSRISAAMLNTTDVTSLQSNCMMSLAFAASRHH